MSVDVEGGELKVLKSIDLSKYFVKLILVEQNNNDQKLVNYLSRFGYQIIKKNRQKLSF